MSLITLRLIAKIFVVNEAGEVLILRRSATNTRRPLGWDLPGGKVEQDEDPNAAVLRELQEEAGIVANDSALFSSYSELKEFHLVWLLYQTILKGKTPDVKLSFEHDQFQWIKPEDIVNYDIPEKYQIAIKKLSKLRKA